MSIEIRRARPGDGAGIQRVFRATYGEGYCHPEVYDAAELEGWIAGEEVLVFVAARADGAVVGTAMLDLRLGTDRNRMGEFGRLCVHPADRGHGLGTRLMQVRLEATERRIDLGLAETRAAHPASTAIGLRQGFRPVGFLPSKDRFAGRESSVLMVRPFGDALERRVPSPRIVASVAPLARHALAAFSLPQDFVVARPEPVAEAPDARVTVAAAAPRGRIETLAIAGSGVEPATLAWRWSPRHGRATLETLRSSDPTLRRTLLTAMVERAERSGALYLEADVRAGDLVAQQTLGELGFRPAAYVPTGAVGPTGRLDLVRMVRRHPAADLGPLDLHPAARPLAALVLDPDAGRARTVPERHPSRAGPTRLGGASLRGSRPRAGRPPDGG